MKVYEGKSVFNGIAIGKIKLYLKGEQQVKRHKVTDVKAELLRYEEARNKSMTELKGLYEKALKEVGEANAAIFEVHQMMLEDEDYNESVRNIIESQGVNAEYAVATTGDNFSKMFSSMEDEYMKERAADVKDISERVISVLNGKSSGNDTGDEASIIVADDLAPSETVQLDKDKVLSFVTVHGSLNSHTAILARTMAIPALVDTPLPLDEEIDGVMAVVDGTKGVIYIDPDCETLELMKKRKAEEDEKRVLLQTLKGKDNITVDGQKIMLYANIGNIKDLAKVIQNDAGGIGLFRSEFIYLDASDEDVVKAAQIAQATEFIDNKAEKYDSPIAQGGTNVSGGQKQRLSIARAIAKHPRVFIFDDSFSALDLKTDAILRKELAANVSDATVIIVAQRISTILHADQILVMDDGKIVGKGTHEELMKTCETYQQIASSQLSDKELGKEA